MLNYAGQSSIFSRTHVLKMCEHCTKQNLTQEILYFCATISRTHRRAYYVRNIMEKYHKKASIGTAEFAV